MGYGGFITWTPLLNSVGKFGRKCVLYNGSKHNLVHDEVFDRVTSVTYDTDKDLAVWFNIANQECVYLTMHGDRVKWKPEKLHMAARILRAYGMPCDKIDPFFVLQKQDQIEVPEKAYIVIEPHSKTSFTPNKQYPFEKWQTVVNALKKDFNFVQVGVKGSRVLENVTSLVGQTTFMQAAWIIENSVGFVSTEGGLAHAATAVGVRPVVIFTGYMPEFISAYPENFNINISTHDESCGLLVPCEHCRQDRENHDPQEIIETIYRNYI